MAARTYHSPPFTRCVCHYWLQSTELLSKSVLKCRQSLLAEREVGCFSASISPVFIQIAVVSMRYRPAMVAADISRYQTNSLGEIWVCIVRHRYVSLFSHTLIHVVVLPICPKFVVLLRFFIICHFSTNAWLAASAHLFAGVFPDRIGLVAKLYRYASCMCSVTFEVDVAADSSKYQTMISERLGPTG